MGRGRKPEEKSIVAAADGKDRKKGEAVLIPVILTPKDQSKKTKIWVKAVPTKNIGAKFSVDSQDHEFVEFLLGKALEEVQSEEKPSLLVENQVGQIEITLDTMLCMGENKERVRMMNLSNK